MSEGEDRSLVESTLVGLSGNQATGCLTVRAAEGEYARVYLDEGRVYAVEVPGPRPVLGTRLVTLGAAESKDVFDALDRQWADLDRWALGVLMVELGYAEREVVEQGAREYLLDGLTDLLQWKSVTCDFRPDLSTRKDLVGPFEVEDLLTEAKARREEWTEHVAVLGQADPVVAPAGRPGDDLDAVTKAVARGIRAEQPLSQVAEHSGFSLLEIARAVRALTEAGAVAVSEPPEDKPTAVEAEDAAGDTPATDVPDGTRPNGDQGAPASGGNGTTNGVPERAHKDRSPAAGAGSGTTNPRPAASS